MPFTGLQDVTSTGQSILGAQQIALRRQQLQFEQQQAAQAEARRQEEEAAARRFYTSELPPAQQGRFAGAPIDALHSSYLDSVRQQNQVQDESRRAAQTESERVGMLPFAYPGTDFQSVDPSFVGPPSPGALSAYSAPAPLVREMAMDNVRAQADQIHFPLKLEQQLQTKSALMAQAEMQKRQQYERAFLHFTNDYKLTPERANQILAKQFPEYAAPMSEDMVHAKLIDMQSRGIKLDPTTTFAIQDKLRRGEDVSGVLMQAQNRAATSQRNAQMFDRGRAAIDLEGQAMQAELAAKQADEVAKRYEVSGAPPEPKSANFQIWAAANMKRQAAEQRAVELKIQANQAKFPVTPDMRGTSNGLAPAGNPGPMPGRMSGQPQSADPDADALSRAIQQLGPGASEQQIFDLAARLRAGASR